MARYSINATAVAAGGVVHMALREKNVLDAKKDILDDSLLALLANCKIVEENPMNNSITNEAFPINGQAKYSIYLSDIPEIKLPNWPPWLSMLENTPELKLSWEIANHEANRHLKKLLSWKLWSPYPTHSYCLGNAEVQGNIIHVRYFLFPLKFPSQQDHAVAQVIYQTPIGAPDGKFERIWVDALREDELSKENLKYIKMTT